MGPFDWKSRAGIVAVERFIIIIATIVLLLLWSEIMQAVECIAAQQFPNDKINRYYKIIQNDDLLI